jgi:hypothetical protein
MCAVWHALGLRDKFKACGSCRYDHSFLDFQKTVILR